MSVDIRKWGESFSVYANDEIHSTYEGFQEAAQVASELCEMMGETDVFNYYPMGSRHHKNMGKECFKWTRVGKGQRLSWYRQETDTGSPVMDELATL